MSDADLDFLRQISERQQRPARSAGGPHGGRGRRRKKVKKSRRVAPLMAIVFLLTVVCGGGYVGYTALNRVLNPPDYKGSGTGSVTVQIHDGDSVRAIGARLHRAQVVKSSDAFVKVANKDPRAVSIQPGFYELRLHMSASSALALLLNPQSRANTTLTIPEGWRLSQTLQALAKKTGIPLKEFQQAAAKPARLGLPAYARGNLEGYLFPARYDLDPDATPADLLKMMVTRFTKEFPDLERRAHKAHMTAGEVIVVASLIQAEGGRTSDYPKIARVLYNRLARNDRLQLDSTVLYALNKRAPRVYNRDLLVRSPYNTYMIRGLPPAAIDSPGKPAIEAALKPAKGKWYWFVTTDPGRKITKFTDKESQFVKFREELDAYLTRHGQ